MTKEGWLKHFEAACVYELEYVGDIICIFPACSFGNSPFTYPSRAEVDGVSRKSLTKLRSGTIANLSIV